MTPEAGEALLRRLGIEVENVRGDELSARCPGHYERTGRDDSNPSWSFNADSGMHNCFSCGFKGGLLYLVAFQRELFRDGHPDWDAAKDWLSGEQEVDLSVLMSRLTEATKRAMPFKPVEMSEARLGLFSLPPVWALKNRGISMHAVQHHGVLWNDRNTSWITPIRDAVSASLLGWQEKGEGHRYFRNRPAGVQKSLTMFGLDVWDGPTMIVVESPLDVVRLTSVGIEGGVATYGASVSAAQVSLMMQADNLILGFDNDAAGKKASEFLLAQSRKQFFECRFLDYSETKAKDVGDMTEDEVRSALDNSKHCVLGKAALA